ncbi:GNAT family N-acetyltransferase [Fundidesulfovibrio agrisoli]|uniref:GNAT family N-acetyltransferase n=1 Tax=Fundidesulfovibrio agrisoli TaxID=2922717 RepID=UPI001FAD88B6|nr:GNAT family protein [Fundidesulfovibrio agrisoli]
MTVKHQPVLEGGKVRLVPLAAEHLERSRKWVNDPFIMSTVLRVSHVTPEDHQRWFANILSDPGKLVYAILWKPGGIHIGNTGLYHLDMTHLRGEFWIYLGEAEYRGMGAASETLGLMKQLSFDMLGLRKLYLHVGLDNLPARSLYSRHGFREDGVLRQHYHIGGKPVDVAVMSQLRQEYDDNKHDA